MRGGQCSIAGTIVLRYGKELFHEARLDTKESGMVKTHIRKHLHCMIVLVLSLVLPGAGGGTKLIEYQGREIFLNGMNIAWHYFGTDVGTHYQWGPLYDPNYFEDLFTEMEEIGINCVRYWIHTDGRSNPEFDDSGYVTGVDPNFYDDLDDVLYRAAGHNILVILVLWSFDMAVINEGGGKYAGTHIDLIVEPDKQQSYINRFLIPFCEFIKDKRGVLAVETMNEPEWVIDYIPTSADIANPATRKQVGRFNGHLASVIHRYSGKMVTVGVSAAFQSPNSPEEETLDDMYLFSPESLLVYNYGDTAAYFDFYQLHWYDWMNDDYWRLDAGAVTAEDLGLEDKPVIWGELPCRMGQDSAGASGDEATTRHIMSSLERGYAGNLFWSVSDSVAWGNWRTTAAPGLRAFAQKYPQLVRWNSGLSKREKVGAPTGVEFGNFETEGDIEGWKSPGNDTTVVKNIETCAEHASDGRGSLKITLSGVGARKSDGGPPDSAQIETEYIPFIAEDFGRYRALVANIEAPEPPAHGSVNARLYIKSGEEWIYTEQESATVLDKGNKRIVYSVEEMAGAGDPGWVRAIGVRIGTSDASFTGDIYIDNVFLTTDTSLTRVADRNEYRVLCGFEPGKYEGNEQIPRDPARIFLKLKPDVRPVRQIYLGRFEEKGDREGWRVADFGNGKALSRIEQAEEHATEGRGALKLRFHGMNALKVGNEWPNVAGIETIDLPFAAQSLFDCRSLVFHFVMPDPPDQGIVQAKVFFKTGDKWRYLEQKRICEVDPGESVVAMDLTRFRNAELYPINAIGIQFLTYNVTYSGELFMDEVYIEQFVESDEVGDQSVMQSRTTTRPSTFGSTGVGARYPE